MSKDFTVNGTKKTGLNELVYNFSVSFETINARVIRNIHKYFMKKKKRKKTCCINAWI